MKVPILKILFFAIIPVFIIKGYSCAQPRQQMKRSLWPRAKSVLQVKNHNESFNKWEERLSKAKNRNHHLNIAICHTTLGVLLFNKGKLNESLSHYDKALTICEDKGYLIVNAVTRAKKGLALTIIGKKEEALECLAVGIKKARAAENYELSAKISWQTSDILISGGQFEKAVKFADYIREIAEEFQDTNLLLRYYQIMGDLHLREGKFEAAEKYLSDSLKLSTENNQKIFSARTLMRLGDLCKIQEQHDCGLDYYKQSLALTESLRLKIAIPKLYDKMGKIFLEKENNSEALKYLNKSGELAEEIGYKGVLASSSKSLCHAYGRAGETDKALKAIRKAIEIYREIDIPAKLQDCLYLEGIFLEKKGDTSGAEKSYKDSVDILDTIREDLSTDEQKTIAKEEKRGKEVYDRLISVLMKTGKSSEGLKYIEKSRMKNERDQFDQIQPEFSNEEEKKASEKERELREQLEETRVELADEKLKPEEEQNSVKIAALEERLNVKKQDYIEYINTLRDEFPDLASLLAIQPDSLIDLQELLPDQAAIIQYLIMEDKLYIFLVTRDSLSYKEVNIAKSILEGKIDYLRSLLMNPQIPMNIGPLNADTLKPVEESRSGMFDIFIAPFILASEDLYNILLRPIEKELAGFKVLGLIPNGKLHLLPFQALGKKIADDSFEFIIQDRSLFQLNSQSILKFAQKRAKAIGKEGKLIAFGNPDNSLEYAEKEIEMVKEVFNHYNVFIREKASEDVVKRELKGYDILHFATHGKMKGEIKKSYILLSPSPDGKEDGKLFLREIWGLSLRKYQLVTLSACETAKGKEASGDVMVSLETAFLRAGTPTIMASLWEVDDEATGVFMKTFYQSLIEKGKADALREAQLSLMKDPRFAYPYYWAPFILVGDWR